MPQIKGYTRKVANQQMMQAQTSPQAFGADQRGAMADAQALQNLTQAAAQINRDRISREDVINEARLEDAFNQDIMSEYARYKTEEDLLDTAIPKQFNDYVRSKVDEYVGQFTGSADAATRLQATLLGHKSRFISGMNKEAYTAQQAFVADKIGSHIESLSAQVKDNPAYAEQAFLDLDLVIDKYQKNIEGPVEIDFLDMGRDAILSGALNSYVDSGQHEEAKRVIDENPLFAQNIPPEKLKSIVTEINAGLQEKEKAIRETRQELQRINFLERELGVEISPQAKMQAIGGIKEADGPMQKLEAISKAVNISIDQMPASAIASAYNVEWPEGDVTEQKKNIISFIKTPIQESMEVKTRVDSVLMQADQFFQTGNQQAGLAAMIAFQKLIDDGAAVREGDIRLSAEGVSAYDKIQLQLQKIGEGGIATQEQMRQMVESAKVFKRAALEARKSYIDPYMQDVRKMGMPPRDVGLPQQSYDQIFEGVQTKTDIKTQALQKAENFAKQQGMTLDKFLKKEAEARGISIEQVKKDVGIE